METTAGSWMLLGSIVPRDAFVVSKLREAGAVLLGKATMSEWADMRSNNYSEGYSPRGDQPRSPYNLTVNPGGSSTGSAIAVSANMIPFSLGTETDGSGTELVILLHLSERKTSVCGSTRACERNLHSRCAEQCPTQSPQGFQFLAGSRPVYNSR